MSAAVGVWINSLNANGRRAVMKVHSSWACVAAVVGAGILAGCTTPTTVTKYDVASQLEEKADKAMDVQVKARNYTDAIAKYNEFIAQSQMAYPKLVPYAAYKIALCYRGLQKKSEAMAAYEQVIDKYPGTEPASWSRAEMAELEKIMNMKPLPEPMPMTPAPARRPAPASAPAK